MTKKKRKRGSESEPKPISKAQPSSPESSDASRGDATDATGPSESPAVVRKPKRFRRTRIALWIIVPTLIALRVALAVSIAPILERVAESYGLEARYENLSLSLLGADVELWHLIIVDSADDAELVHVEYCRADLSVLDLLRGRIVVKRVEADGLDVFIERDETGRVPALDRLLARAQSDAPAEPPVEPSSDGSLAPKNLDPPVRVDALRLQHVLVHVRDRSVSPPLDTRIHTNVRLSNIGHPVHRPRFSFEVNAEGVLDGLWVEGVASTDSEQLVADLDVDLRNLYLEPLRPYLARAGFEPIAERWSGRFQGRADVTSGSRDGEPYLDAHLRLSDASFGVASGDRWTLDTVQLHIELARNEVRFHGGRVSGGRALARRATTGQVELLGLRTIDPVHQPTVAPPPRENPPIAATPQSAPPSAPTPGPILLGFESFVFEDLQATIIDQRVEPTSEFLFSLDRLALESTGDETLSIQGTFRAPGLAERGQVDGQARLALPRSHLDLAVTTEGIDPDAARLQLDSARLESILEAGLIQFRIEAGLEITRERLSSDFALRDFAFNDQQQWAGMGAMRVEGIQVDRATGGLHVDEIAIESPQLEVRRDRDEHIVALGLRWDPNPAPPAERAEANANPRTPSAVPAVKPKPPHSTKTARSRPPIHVARVRWTDTKIRYSDESIDGAEPLEISDLGIEVDDLFIADAPDADAPRGRVRGWIALPGVAESLRLDGTLTPIPGGTRLEASVTGENLNGDRLGPYLETVGMKETLDSGALALTLIAHFSMEGETMRAGLELRGFELRDGDVTWLACGSLEVPEVTIAPGRIAIEPVTIDAPSLRVDRHDDGTWEALGVRTLSNRLDQEKTAEVLDQPPPAPDLGAAPTIEFGGLRLSGATLQLVDAPSKRNWFARSDFTLAPLAWSRELSRSEWSLKASVDGAAEAITVDGDLRASHDRFGAALSVRARGIGHELANVLLPPELRVELADGEFSAEVSFQSQTHEAGGQSLNAAIRDVRLWEGEREHLKLDVVEADVQRIDLLERVVEIGAVRATGLALQSSRDEAGVLRAVGVAVHPAKPQREAPPTRTEGGAGGVAVTENAPSRSQRARSIWQTPPHLSVASIELGASAIEWFDATTMAEPLRLEELVLESVEPWAALGAEQESFPALQLRVVGRVEPGLAKLDTRIALSPFSTPLFIEITPALREIDGSQFDRVFAPIEHQVSLAGLEAGAMEAKLVASLTLARRSPLEFDFSRSFTGELELSGARLRDGEQTWVGVDAVRVTGVRLDLPREIRIADIEIDRPQGRIDRTPAGILAFGAQIPDPTRPETSREPKPNGPTSQETRPSDAESSVSPSETESASSAPGTTTPPTAPSPPARVGQVALAERTTRSAGPIISVERVTVSGLDFVVNDTTTEHEMHLPFTGLDVLVQDVTTSRRPEKPVRFNLFVEGGRARAPGADAETPVMGELNLAGQLQLGKPLVGEVRLQVVQFDLSQLRGPAKSLDITLTEGFFDLETEFVFRKDGQLLGDTLAVFTDLSISEGEDGPIRRLLKLPAPLDAALFLVRDASNAVRIPVEVQLNPEYISLVEITRATIAAMGTVLSTAIINSPLRVGGALTDLVGLTGSEKLVDPEPPVDLSFAPGELTANRSTRNVLDELIARMKREPKLQLVFEHELGQADLEVARRRANPPVERSRQLVEQLRSRRRELIAERPRLAQAAYSSLLAGVHQRSDAALRVLQTTDNELGLIERSLDRLYELIEPGGEHRALKRQREAAVAMARARIDGVIRRITDRGVDPARLRVRPPRFSEPTVEGGGHVRVVPSLIESPRR